VKLQRDAAALLIIDVQQKLMPVIHDAEAVVANIERLIRGAHILGVPALLTEQYVKGLGPTIDSVRLAFEETYDYAPFEKAAFSAAGCLPSIDRAQILIAGVEAHVCVYQSAMDLLAAGHEVTILEDAVSSRTPRNRDIALRRLAQEGVKSSSTEMALFELCAVSGTDEFRAISQLVK
jgi:nicotinamidase-related amidase